MAHTIVNAILSYFVLFLADYPIEILRPCVPDPCGSNAKCIENNGIGSCQCLPEYYGDPYAGCRPECTTNNDCALNLNCVQNKCQNPCPSSCAQNADCFVRNHFPTCTCREGFTGDPYSFCHLRRKLWSPSISIFYSQNILNPSIENPLAQYDEPEVNRNPCFPSPCGPNSLCRTINDQAVCTCAENYIGQPPSCRPECVLSSECPSDKSCERQKCVNPCITACGIDADCRVHNHSPICTCKINYVGDPFTRCYRQPRKFTLKMKYWLKTYSKHPQNIYLHWNSF